MKLYTIREEIIMGKPAHVVYRVHDEHAVGYRRTQDEAEQFAVRYFREHGAQLVEIRDGYKVYEVSGQQFHVSSADGRVVWGTEAFWLHWATFSQAGILRAEYRAFWNHVDVYLAAAAPASEAQAA
jgi:hypothetical protein